MTKTTLLSSFSFLYFHIHNIYCDLNIIKNDESNKNGKLCRNNKWKSSILFSILWKFQVSFHFTNHERKTNVTVTMIFSTYTGHGTTPSRVTKDKAPSRQKQNATFPLHISCKCLLSLRRWERKIHVLFQGKYSWSDGKEREQKYESIFVLHEENMNEEWHWTRKK